METLPLLEVEKFQVKEILISYRNKRKKKAAIKNEIGAASLLRELLPDNSREHFIALYLDGAHQPVSFRVTSGSVNSCMVDPKVIFQGAVLVGAAALIVAHNHPSGVLTPSSEDHKVTERLKEGSKILGVPLLDHIILGNGDDRLSFSSEGLL